MFVPVTMELLMGFWKSIQVFVLTLLFSIPLGLVVCFGSMSKWQPLRFLEKSWLRFFSGWMPIRWLTGPLSGSSAVPL